MRGVSNTHDSVECDLVSRTLIECSIHCVFHDPADKKKRMGSLHEWNKFVAGGSITRMSDR